MRQLFLVAFTLTLVLGFSNAALATSVTFNISANGANEVSAGGTPNQGDSDGTVIGTLKLDNVAGSADLNMTVANLDFPLSGWHIHQAAINTTGAIVLNFGNPESIRSGNSLITTVSGLNTTTIDAVFANPSGFYFNLHNNTFPGGAARMQLPEPGSLLLLSAGLIGMVTRPSRRRD